MSHRRVMRNGVYAGSKLMAYRDACAETMRGFGKSQGRDHRPAEGRAAESEKRVRAMIEKYQREGSLETLRAMMKED